MMWTHKIQDTQKQVIFASFHCLLDLQLYTVKLDE